MLEFKFQSTSSVFIAKKLTCFEKKHGEHSQYHKWGRRGQTCKCNKGHFRHLWKMKAKKQWKLKKNTTESGCEEDNEHVLLGIILWTFNGNTQYLVLQQRFCIFPFGHLSLCHFLPFSWLKFLRHTLEPRNEKRLQNEGYIFYTNNSLYSEFSQNDYKVWCVYLSQNDTLQGMFSKLTGKVLSKLWT